jgi:hypothetical protein
VIARARLALAVLLLLVDQLLDSLDARREWMLALRDLMEARDRFDGFVEEVADHEQVRGPVLEARALGIVLAREVELFDECFDLVAGEVALRVDDATLD